MIREQFKKLLLALGVCLVLTLPSFGQFNATMYHLRGVVPQSYLINPSQQPMCGFYLGLPGASPFNLSAGIPFKLNDLLWYDEELDSTITFLHPNADLGEFLKKVGKNNFSYAEVTSNIASWGFRAGDMFFSFDITNRVRLDANIPGGMFELLEGWENGDVRSFNNAGLNMRAYQEYSMGVSKKFTDRLSIGLRGKILMGLADITSKSSNFQFQGGLDEIVLTSDMTVRTSVPFTEFYFDENGYFVPDSTSVDEDIAPEDALDLIGKNLGLALDVGVTYELLDRFILSASIVDFGRIKWKHNPYVLKQDAEYRFTGLTADSLRSDTYMDGFADTILNTFKNIPGESEPYSTFLPAKIYLGARFDVTERFSLGALSRTEFYKSRLYEQFTLSTNFYPGKLLSFSLSYTMQNHSYNNFGFGISSKLLPFNFYLLFDNITLPLARDVDSGIIIPHKMNSANFMVGFNLVFGCNRTKKLMRDKPMLEL